MAVSMRRAGAIRSSAAVGVLSVALLAACASSTPPDIGRAGAGGRASATPTPPRPLRPGDHGPAVTAVQQRLTDLGYWLGAVDGTWDDLTTQAIYALQKTAGITVDGIVDEATRKAIETGIVPVPRSTGNAVEIDVERQVLIVVRGGKAVSIHNTSTGSNVPYSERVNGVVYTGDARTPRGSFQVFRDVDANDPAPLGDMWRPKYFKGGVAVHGHPSVPTYGASHGCARLTVEAMDLIWRNDWMPIGSTVLTY